MKHAAWSTVHLEIGDLEVAYSTSLRDDLVEELSFLGRTHFQSDARYSHGPPNFELEYDFSAEMALSFFWCHVEIRGSSHVNGCLSGCILAFLAAGPHWGGTLAGSGP